MQRLRSYQGLTALVTGASSGIGRLMALRFAREGARVALVARRVPQLQELAAEVTSRGGEALVLPCDVADREQVSTAAAKALQHYGAIDILVNNAGYGRHRRFLQWDLDDMERIMRVNYLGALYWTKALLPQMVDQRRGWIVFVASVAGRIGVPEETAYVASKFAMVGLGEALSLEVEDEGVHVLTVCPGAIRTDFFDEEALTRMPAAAKSRMIEPEPLVDAIMNALASGKREITVPRSIAPAYVAKAVVPGLMRRAVKRATLPARTGTRQKPDTGVDR